MDESLAASDVVVVSASGFGSDALVKRRPVVVFHVNADLDGQNWDLVTGWFPHCRTAEELTRALATMAHDQLSRRQKVAEAEDYVLRFCSRFGHDSVKQLADHVRELAAGQVLALRDPTSAQATRAAPTRGGGGSSMAGTKVLFVNDSTSNPNWGDRASAMSMRHVISCHGASVVYSIYEEQVFRSSLDSPSPSREEPVGRPARSLAKQMLPPGLLDLRRKLLGSRVDRSQENTGSFLRGGRTSSDRARW